MTWTKLTLGAAAMLALVGPATAQNLLTNSDFEADTAPTAASASGWASGGFGRFPGNGGVRNDSFSVSGNYYYLNEAPGFEVSLSQVISFNPGEYLNLSGLYSTRVFGTGTNSFVIQVTDGTTNALLHQASFSPTGANNWTAFNYNTGVLNSSTVRVTYISQVGADDDYMIDNLVAQSINPSAAPEPSAGLLALLGVPVLFRRRK